MDSPSMEKDTLNFSFDFIGEFLNLKHKGIEIPFFALNVCSNELLVG